MRPSDFQAREGECTILKCSGDLLLIQLDGYSLQWYEERVSFLRYPFCKYSKRIRMTTFV